MKVIAMRHRRSVQPDHVAVVGNALPRRCGLATYTTHSVAALRERFPAMRVDHYAVDDGHGAVYGTDVAGLIAERDVASYVRMGAEIERSGAQALWIQHEFGIFGGPAGEHLLSLLRHVSKPLLMTLHTVLERPDADQMRVMRALADRVDRFIVMADHAARLLTRVYGIDQRDIVIIPHGAPDRALVATSVAKRKLHMAETPLILTFGLLSPGKGIEDAIAAMPAIVAAHPDATYLIAGATHPALIRHQGEAYREALIAKAEELNVGRNVRFINDFLDNDSLLDLLQACDVYLTPYLGRDQVTSGTLSYALSMGRPVVATPYIHAEEALADGIGTIVPFADPDAISAACNALLADPAKLVERTQMIWEAARPTIWSNNADAVNACLTRIIGEAPVNLATRRETRGSVQVDLSGVAAMTDDVGIIQHTIHGVQDRRHGYCIDDNARALMLVCQVRTGDPSLRRSLAARYAAFVQHGWCAERRRFRNFMGYDRSWLEDEGSEDSNGRTLWALGTVVRDAQDPALRRWATGLFNDALGIAEEVGSPRAIAFALLGMAAMLEAEPGHQKCAELTRRHLDLFIHMLEEARRPEWPWFEAVLAYDNARLPQAMIEAGRAVRHEAAVAVGLETLAWIIEMQTGPRGIFRPVGTESFGKPYAQPEPFDQQPLEAAATVDACAAAWGATGETQWVEHARTALRWFTGDNDLGLSLVDEKGGLCYDGLTPAGVNLNQGAESTLAMQMALLSAQRLAGPLEQDMYAVVA